MLNCLASLVMLTSLLKALPGKLDIKRHSPSILYHDIASESDIMPCIKITEPQVVYIYSNKKETSDFHGTVSFDPVKILQQK